MGIARSSRIESVCAASSAKRSRHYRTKFLPRTDTAALLDGWRVMKKTFPFGVALLGLVLFPPLCQAAAGYLYESDFSTGKIFQFTTTPSGTVAKVEFAKGLENVRGLAFDREGNLFVGQATTIIKITPIGFT